jgi:hypothetical protein
MKQRIIIVVMAAVVGVVAVADMKLMKAMESGDMETAVALAKKTLAKNPDDYDANLAMAFHYEEQESYAEQVKCLNKCLKEDPDSPVAINCLAMAYLNLGEIIKAEEMSQQLEEYASEPSVKDTLRQIKMVKEELANPNAAPVVSNILDAVAIARDNNKGIGNAPVFYLKSFAQTEERGKTCWKGSYITMVPSHWRPYPIELFFKVYPSGRVAIVRENRQLSRFCEPKFSYNNYIRHFQIAKPDIAGVTAIEDSDDWPVLLRLKSGLKIVLNVTVADLVETGITDFKKRIAQADKIVIRDGGVNWDLPTDKDPVLCTIVDPKEIAAFNKMFAFVEKADWQPSDIGQQCRCQGGPGIDWWKGEEKLAQTALHHGKSLWWGGFTWDFFLTPPSKDAVAKWFSAHSLDLKIEEGKGR